jgi:hypothetical protein
MEIFRQPHRPPPPSSRTLSERGPASVRFGAGGSFLADMVVESWVRSGEATRAGALLILRDGRCLALQDAMRVLGRRNGDTDPYGFTGRVEPIREFVRKGAVISGAAMRLGPAVYDIEFGVIALVVSASESG